MCVRSFGKRIQVHWAFIYRKSRVIKAGFEGELVRGCQVIGAGEGEGAEVFLSRDRRCLRKLDGRRDGINGPGDSWTGC